MMTNLLRSPLLFIWLFFVLSQVLSTGAIVDRGIFIDSDDMIHMVRVIDWLQGQGWSDPMLYRLSPPQGTLSHFSRLVELPLAAMVWGGVHMLHLSMTSAAEIAACIYPVLLFALLLVVVRWAGQEIVGEKHAPLCSLLLLFIPLVLLQYLPGRADHHGMALVATFLALGGVLRLIKGAGVGLAFLTGLCLAFAQSIAMETLPWVVFLSACVGVWLIVEGRRAVRPALAYVFSLSGAASFFLFVAKGGQGFLTLDPLQFSFLYVVLDAAIALVFVAAALVSWTNKTIIRLIVGALASCLVGGAFLTFFPTFWQGPYGAMDPALAGFMMRNIGEALPEIQKIGGWSDFFEKSFLSCAALLVSLWFLLQAKNLKVWIVITLFLWTTLLLGFFYQGRVLLYAHALSVFPLAALFVQVRERMAGKWDKKLRWAVLGGLFLLIGPVWGVMVPAVLNKSPFVQSVLLFPAYREQDSAEAKKFLWAFLADPHGLGNRPRVILNGFSDAGALLLYTPHQALGGLYHTNVSGNLDVLSFFKAQNDQAAYGIVKRRGVGLVLFQATLLDHLGEAKNVKRLLARRLVEGDIPAWLKKVELPFPSEDLLFEVVAP